METIDLRSDTVTHPTPEMREVMATARVGDDVFGDDPTVIQLEAEAAEMFGQEAGLFVSSGTQGNVVSLLAQCQRGDEIIVGDKAHIILYEGGALSALGGIVPRTLPVQDDGTLQMEAVKKAIRGDNVHFPRTRLITIENTQGTIGGIPVSVEYTDAVADIVHEHGLKFHIDGARIFNAAAAFNVDVKELTHQADSVTFCLSKGLGAPVGSIIVGSKAFILEARRIRKILGGGMRQVGILAAAGLVSLRTMSKRLHEDHANAAKLAEGLKDIPGIKLLNNSTNFVFFDLLQTAVVTPDQLIQTLEKEYNVITRLYPGYTHTFRFVTHYWITEERVAEVVKAIKTILS